MAGYTDKDILKTIQGLIHDLPNLVSQSDAQALTSQLTEIFSDIDDINNQSNVVTQALRIICEYPKARDELKARLIREYGVTSEVRLNMSYEEQPGHGEPIKPGSKVVCPVDPGHYIVRLRRKGQRCPQHNVELVEASEIRERNNNKE